MLNFGNMLRKRLRFLFSIKHQQFWLTKISFRKEMNNLWSRRNKQGPDILLAFKSEVN